jgi:hypothetical protein
MLYLIICIECYIQSRSRVSIQGYKGAGTRGCGYGYFNSGYSAVTLRVLCGRSAGTVLYVDDHFPVTK